MANVVERPTNVAEQSVESSASGVEWAAILAGAAGAMGVTTILLALGPGLGLAASSPWSFNTPAPTVFTTAAAVWLIVTQWLSASFGGYLSGRLRKKWVGIRTDEVLFRDTTHGFLSWAVATLLMATVVALATGTAGVAASASDAAQTAVPATADAAEHARKIAVTFAFTTSISLLIGAFVGAAAGGLGGYHRDES